MDDSARALPLFDRALVLARSQLREAVQGKAECLEELASPEDAASFRRQIADDLTKLVG